MLKMPKKYSLTLPDLIADGLDRLAASEGNRPTTLATFIIERHIRSLLEQGQIPSPSKEKSPQQLNSDDSALIRLIELITEGGDLSTEAIAQAALAANVDPVELSLKLEKLKNGNGETTRV